MANIQYMTDSRGQRVSVVVPVELFEKLVSSSDLDEFYEPVTIDAGHQMTFIIPMKSLIFFLRKIALCKLRGVSIEA